MENKVWNEKEHRWEYENGGRVCTINNKTLEVVLDNCKEFLRKRNTIYLEDVGLLLEKALEYVSDKKDLSCGEQEAIKRIRRMMKGL